MHHEIIPGLSEYETLLKEVRELQARIAELTALRDDLIYHICPALRAVYEEKIGSLEREILAAKLYLREKQRILEILQAQLNRQEVMSVHKAEEKAGEEFREFEEELHRKAEEEEAFRRHWSETQWEKHDREAEAGKKAAEEESEAGEAGEAEEAEEQERCQSETDAGAGEQDSEEKEETFDEDEPQSGGRKRRNPVETLKKLYRKIVKRLHPDVHPDLTEREKELFNEAVAAYEAGDLEKLKAIWEELENDTDPEERFEDKPEDLEKLREMLKNLRIKVQILTGEIARIRSEYPYTMKDFLEDEEAVEKKRAELQKQLQEIREADAKLAEFIEQVRKKVQDPWRN